MKKNNTIKTMTIAAVLGGMGVAGYMYLKNNPEITQDMKIMMKDMTRKKFVKLDEDV